LFLKLKGPEPKFFGEIHVQKDVGKTRAGFNNNREKSLNK
jgi:hypothetical protein